MSQPPARTAAELLAEALAQWQSRATDSKLDEQFLRLYYRNLTVEELAELSPAAICAPAASHRELGQRRMPGRPRINVFNPDSGVWGTSDTVVEVITDDAPFLVSSATNAMARLGLNVHRVLHPQLRLERDLHGELLDLEPGAPGLAPIDESWMHFEVDRQVDEAARRELERTLNDVLADVHHVDEDADKLRRRATGIAEALPGDSAAMVAGGVDEREIGEAVEFLRWLSSRNFTFMGYREYDLVTTSGEPVDSAPEGAQLALRPVAGTGLGLLRQDVECSESFAALPPEAQELARGPHVLVLTKANSRSTVHQPKYLDYIGVKKFDASGRVVGERRFLGLYTHEAETTSVSDIPILGRTLREVLTMTGCTADSYDGRDIIEVVDRLPREELFQVGTDELHEIVRGVLRLRARRDTKLFMRRDPFGRYVTCLVYMSRDRYTTRVRLDVQNVLLRAFRGASIDHTVQVGSSPLAMLYLVVRANREQRHSLPEVDQAKLEAQVAAATRSWDDDLMTQLSLELGSDAAARLVADFSEALGENYKFDVSVATAADDLQRLAGLAPEELTVSLYRSAEERWRLRVYRRGVPLSLSRMLPLLEYLGVEVADERPYEIVRDDEHTYWIYDFGLGEFTTARLPVERLRSLFEEAFLALWHGRAEADAFNALVLRGGLDWRQVSLLRAYSRYLRQAGTTFSQDYIADVLGAHTHLSTLLVRLFESRFTPAAIDTAARAERSEAIAEEARGSLEQVASLDHDRILRSLLAAVEATLRTNYYQTDPDTEEPKPYLVLKLDPHRIPDLPAPRPRFEMFVYSPRVEGVHLRFGSVARGGLRWSDRLEDYRVEVLGLVKAQQVKNAVIVPSGAKGGFVCKRLPTEREAVRAEVVACYTQFISALLDVTDNRVNGHVEHPPQVVRYDADDSYLVVAADKGTATFSDIANDVAAARGFWLGDAFASGGSVGYDHKAMGITARGAWESVKYHALEMGLDVQRQDVTVVGIGDMSGDVFGNGMLLSPHIRLVAAFDHRHIFLDPDPDAATGFAERQRMFALPRSTWADYDTSLISEGGGVFSRQTKSVPISAQVREALAIHDNPDGTPVTAMTPQALMQAVLRAPVDLLWNGGIGTYVKASTESHASVGDKANDAVRVDATELRCRIVGEGGNLGLTQLARIEFALAGGRVNADFIDNSGGVNTSDHEVNIKIMLDREVRAGALTQPDRDGLFMDMTEEVARLVLADNDQQNVALAAARQQAASMLHVHARYIRQLEREGRIKRKLEFLPDDKVIAERRSQGRGLTGPEFAVLIAHTKNMLEEEILDSDVPSDPYLRQILVDYFPTPLRERFVEAMERHPLRPEIIVNAVVNDLVNRLGSTLAFRVAEETGASPANIARAYVVVRDVFDLPRFWSEIEELRGQVGVDTQLAMMLEARKLAERASRWLLRNRARSFTIGDEVGFFAGGAASVLPQLPELLQGRDLAAFTDRRQGLVDRGVPEGLAQRVAAMVPAYSTMDLVEVAAQTGRGLRAVAEVYFDLADQLQLSRLRERIIALPRDDRWNTMARSAIRDELYAAHAALTQAVLLSGEEGAPAAELRARWVEQNAAALARARTVLSEIWETERFDLATLSVALRAVRGLV